MVPNLTASDATSLRIESRNPGSSALVMSNMLERRSAAVGSEVGNPSSDADSPTPRDRASLRIISTRPPPPRISPRSPPSIVSSV